MRADFLRDRSTARCATVSARVACPPSVGLRQRKSMGRAELADELRTAAEAVDEDGLRPELGPLLPPEELAGLAPRIRSAVIRVAERLGG